MKARCARTLTACAHVRSQDELAPLFDGAAWAGTQLWDAAIQGASELHVQCAPVCAWLSSVSRLVPVLLSIPRSCDPSRGLHGRNVWGFVAGAGVSLGRARLRHWRPRHVLPVSLPLLCTRNVAYAPTPCDATQLARLVTKQY